MSLLPEFQKYVDDAFVGLDLSDDRRAVLQPELEKQIKGFRQTDDGNYGYYIDIVDKDGKKRNGVTLAELVKEVHESVKDDAIPLIENNKNLTAEQLEKISQGKLGLKPEVKKADKEALSQAEILAQKPSLEDIASGKIKVDLTK